MENFLSSCSVAKDYLFQGPAVNMQESDGFAGTFGHDVINDVTVSPDVSLKRCQWLLCFLIPPVQIESKSQSSLINITFASVEEFGAIDDVTVLPDAAIGV